MNLKRTSLIIKDKNEAESGDPKDYPTIADLMRKQKTSKVNSNTVHYRRDLDSLG